MVWLLTTVGLVLLKFDAASVSTCFYSVRRVHYEIVLLIANDNVCLSSAVFGSSTACGVEGAIHAVLYTI